MTELGEDVRLSTSMLIFTYCLFAESFWSVMHPAVWVLLVIVAFGCALLITWTVKLVNELRYSIKMTGNSAELEYYELDYSNAFLLFTKIIVSLVVIELTKCFKFVSLLF